MGWSRRPTLLPPLPPLSGLHVLLDGGNAFDAAIATAVTLSVVEPHMSGVGGIGVALAHVAREGRVRALNFSGRAPGAAEPSRFTEETKETGILAPLVPGSVAGWLTLHERYGTLDRDRLFRPATDYAENGFPVTSLTSYVINESAASLRRFPASAATLLGAGGRAPAPGSLLKMPELASSLRSIAKGGREEFYRASWPGASCREPAKPVGFFLKRTCGDTRRNGRTLSASATAGARYSPHRPAPAVSRYCRR